MMALKSHSYVLDSLFIYLFKKIKCNALYLLYLICFIKAYLSDQIFKNEKSSSCDVIYF